MPRKKGSHVQARRTLRLRQLLRGHELGVRFQVLAKRCKVSHSQLKRDLEAMNVAGHRIMIETESEPPHFRRARLLESYEPVTASRRERFSLLAHQALIKALVGTPFHEDTESLFEKTTERLSTEERRDLRRLRDRIVYIPDGGIRDYRGGEDAFDALLTGVMDQTLVEAAYVGAVATDAASNERGAGAPTPTAPRFRWAVVGVAFYRLGFYVVAAKLPLTAGPKVAATELGQLKGYAAERFRDADWVPGSRYEMPTDLRVADHFEGAFGIVSGRHLKKVVIDFDRRARHSIVGRTWRPGQTITSLPSGGVRLSFEVTSTFEVAAWVMGWGDMAIVVEPPGLRDTIARSATRVVAKYQRAAARSHKLSWSP